MLAFLVGRRVVADAAAGQGLDRGGTLSELPICRCGAWCGRRQRSGLMPQRGFKNSRQITTE